MPLQLWHFYVFYYCFWLYLSFFFLLSQYLLQLTTISSSYKDSAHQLQQLTLSQQAFLLPPLLHRRHQSLRTAHQQPLESLPPLAHLRSHIHLRYYLPMGWCPGQMPLRPRHPQGLSPPHYPICSAICHPHCSWRPTFCQQRYWMFWFTCPPYGNIPSHILTEIAPCSEQWHLVTLFSRICDHPLFEFHMTPMGVIRTPLLSVWI